MRSKFFYDGEGCWLVGHRRFFSIGYCEKAVTKLMKVRFISFRFFWLLESICS